MRRADPIKEQVEAFVRASVLHDFPEMQTARELEAKLIDAWAYSWRGRHVGDFGFRSELNCLRGSKYARDQADDKHYRWTWRQVALFTLYPQPALFDETGKGTTTWPKTRRSRKASTVAESADASTRKATSGDARTRSASGRPRKNARRSSR